MTSVFQVPPREVQLAGFATGAFEPITEAFARLLADQGHGGAALAVYQDDQPVVDLIGGDYRPDSVQLLFSLTKAITSIATHHAVHDGLLDLDAPIAEIWPEFARPSTAAITLRSVLTHRAGLPAVDVELTMEQVLAGELEKALERQEPYWEPNTMHGYHTFTFGVLVDGVFRRVLGRSVGGYVETELRAPLGLDLWIGIPAELEHRVAHSEAEPQWTTPARHHWADAPPIPAGTIAQLRRHQDVMNDPRIHQAGWAAGGGTANAKSLARLLASTMAAVDGVRTLTSERLSNMIAVRSDGIDRVLGFPTRFGSGVQRPFPTLPMLGPSSFGHEGSGGCVAVADPALGLSVAFTTDVFPGITGASQRANALLASIRQCAGA